MNGVVNWHLGRCGSSVLGSLLAQHPDVDYGNEIFSPYMPRRRGDRVLPAIDQVVVNFRSCSQRDFYLFEVKHLPAQNLGLYPSLNVADWLQKFRELGCQNHILCIVATDCVGWCPMCAQLRMGSMWHPFVRRIVSHRPGMLPLEGIRHGFEVRSLLGWLQEYERGWQQMQALFSQCARDSSDFRWLSLTYEDDLAQSPLEGYQRVCSFLGLSAFEPILRYRKLNPGSLSELIVNWDEIRALLDPTPFAWMLED